ncbi:MAG: membrane lipoprotein lipid attachment site-containing protein [Candidatus Komeilibacteria bacterium]|nr:membrane lipoprotein lipid attachment site-containing protein [Candidatus Komeilibacteria bacterium]
MKKSIFFFLILTFVLSGCSLNQVKNDLPSQRDNVNKNEQKESVNINSQPQNIQNNNSEQQNNNTNQESKKPTTLIKIKDDGKLIYYEGKITLSGEYFEYRPETLAGGILCFNADEETGYLIPRDPNIYDRRKPWFCFNNQDEIKKIFGINDTEIFSNPTASEIRGKATVVVSEYVVINWGVSGVYDTATLVQLILKEKYTIKSTPK